MKRNAGGRDFVPFLPVNISEPKGRYCFVFTKKMIIFLDMPGKSISSHFYYLNICFSSVKIFIAIYLN